MQGLLDTIGRGFSEGRLEFAAPDGRCWTLGNGEPRVRLRLQQAAVLRRMLRRPAMNFGETYVDGGWEPEGCSLAEVLGVALRFEQHRQHRQRRHPHPLARLGAWIGERNSPLRARRNVAHHYNLDEAFYRGFLDQDMHYSCAYFREAGITLEDAQREKCALIARKLDLRPDMRVLDIGCGWGSLAMHLAERHGVHVTGITLSETQLAAARRRANERGLTQRVEFRLQDYRDTAGRYDAVVSVGMFEHVGRPQYGRYFARLHQLLEPQGTALVHSIGRLSPPGATNPWIRKYIFPGGYIPAASEMLAAVERSGLELADLEVWRLHYAETLAEWHRRFSRMTLGDERFTRIWRFYLQASEASFREGDLVVFQAQLLRERSRLPLTRDYLYC